MSELERIRDVYNNRKIDNAVRERYSAFDTAYFFYQMQRQRAVLNLLKSYGITSLKSLRILEVGCGNGSVIQEILSFGARQRHLFGIDLLQSRMVDVNKFLLKSTFVCANGCGIPFPDDSFDIVMQFTALSSVLDPSARKKIASEMQRVLRQDGLIIWYDFFWNPKNPETRGIGKKEILASFPNCSFTFTRTTLAPPLARKVAPVSWLFAMLLESMKLLNTHYLVGIQKSNTKKSVIESTD